MLRKIVCGLFALVICVGVILAEDVKGKVEKVDAEKNTIMVKVEGKDKAVKVTLDKDTKLEGVASLKDIKEGATVTISFTGEKKDKKITGVKVEK